MLSPPVAGQDNIHATRPNETVPRRQPLGASMGCGASMPVDQGAPAQNKVRLFSSVSYFPDVRTLSRGAR